MSNQDFKIEMTSLMLNSFYYRPKDFFEEGRD